MKSIRHCTVCNLQPGASLILFLTALFHMPAKTADQEVHTHQEEELNRSIHSKTSHSLRPATSWAPDPPCLPPVLDLLKPQNTRRTDQLPSSLIRQWRG
jgi:hypothetical protein